MNGIKKCRKLQEEEKSLLKSFFREASDSHESRRAQGILLMGGGSSLNFIEALTGFKRRQVFKYRAQFLKEGLCGIANKRKGKPKALLTKAQRDDIIGFLTQNTPDEGV